MKRRRRIADGWAECPWIVRFMLVLALTVFVGSCIPGCSGRIKPWADIELKDESERAVDPRWGAVQRVWIGFTLEF